MARTLRTVAPLLAVSLPGVVGLIVLLASSSNGVAFWGDEALAEVAVGRAIHFDQALGAFSNWGYAHPGPALFYLLAPFYFLSGNEPIGIAIGALSINTGAMVVTVATIRRFVDQRAAWVSASALILYAGFVQGEALWNHWNPSVVPLPVLCCGVLAAMAWSGSPLALGGAAVVGSYVAQTHLGSVPLVGIIGAFGVAGLLTVRRRAGNKHQSSAPDVSRRAWMGSAALVALALGLWIPPLVEQFTSDDGNISTTINFFAEPPRDAESSHSIGDAVGTIAGESLVVPGGWRIGPPAEPAMVIDPATGANRYGFAEVVGWVLALALTTSFVFVLWWDRSFVPSEHRRALLGLAVLPLLMAAALVFSATRVVGPMFNYLLWGAMTSLLPVWIVAGVLAAPFLARLAWGARATTAIVAVVCLLGGGLYLFDIASDGELEPQPLAVGGDYIARKTAPAIGDTTVEVRWDLFDGYGKAIGSAALAALRRDGVDARAPSDIYAKGLGASGDERCLVSIGGGIQLVTPGWETAVMIMEGITELETPFRLQCRGPPTGPQPPSPCLKCPTVSWVAPDGSDRVLPTRPGR